MMIKIEYIPSKNHYSYHLWDGPDGNTMTKCGLSVWAKENGYNESHIRGVYKGTLKKHKNIIKVIKLK